MITPEDIILRLDKIIQLLQNGNIVSSVVVNENKVECPLLFDYLDFWVKNFKVGKVKDSTLVQIKSVIKNHIKKNFENKRLSEYSLMDIQNSLMSVSFSRMREYAYSVLNDAFKKACQLKYITENFVSLVEIPAHKRQEGRALTKEQEKLFFEKAKSSKFYICDLLSGYMQYIIPTFLIKAIMVLIIATIAENLIDKTKFAWIIGSIIGCAFQVFGYGLVETIMYGFAAALLSVPANIIQSIVGTVIAMVLATVLEKSNVLKKLRNA